MFSACGIAMGGPKGQVAFTTPGEYTFVVPAGVFKISALTIGAGGTGYGEDSSHGANGGTGGSLRYFYDFPVTPNEVLTIYVSSSFGATDYGVTDIRRGATAVLRAKGGNATGTIQTPIGAGQWGGTVGGGDGGSGGLTYGGEGGYGGGGAGGYSGNGGIGEGGGGLGPATAGQGGGGGGGSFSIGGAGGGGVGIFGQGSNGTAGSSSSSGGGGGSSGGKAADAAGFNASNGGLYGGGGGGCRIGGATNGEGGNGAVRIIWGDGRAYPATLTGDM